MFKKIRDAGIRYYFGKISDDTNKMLSKFSEAYSEKIVEFEIAKVENIMSAVVNAVTDSVSLTISNFTHGHNEHRRLRRYELNEAEPDWETIPSRTFFFITYDFPRSIQHVIDDVPMQRSEGIVGALKIAENPFAQGAERIAYYAKHGSEDIVLKEYKHEGMNSPKRYEIMNQMHTVAAYLAEKFTEEMKKLMGDWVSQLILIFFGKNKNCYVNV